MHKYINILFSVLSFICISHKSTGQYEMKYNSPSSSTPEWINAMYQTDADPGVVTDLYDKYYATHKFVKNEHTQYYKRWMRSLKRFTSENAKISRKQEEDDRMATWSCIGPFDWDHDAAGRSYAPGTAHVYTVEQSISNEDYLYAGTATSGVFKSTDRGLNWTHITGNYEVGAVYAIEIDHTFENTVYASMMSTIMKTTNGGITWNPTGDASFQALSLNVRDIVMKPDNNEIILAATDSGLYRTLNNGLMWSLITGDKIQEIEFHPTDPNIVYIVKNIGDKTYFWKSTNAGVTFTQTGNGWPNPATGDNQRRTEIAVSPDAPDYVYAHATGAANGGSGLYGIYVSTDQGANWTFECCGPQPAGPPDLPSGNINIMAWQKDGSDDGGQYYYDVAFGVSPFNADSVWAAGVNLWVSANGGSNFVCKAKWSEPNLPEYVHADLHDFHYYEHSGEIWIACDGGIFYSSDNGATFQKRVLGIHGTDFWGFDAGWWEGDIMLGGAYHNGTHIMENDVYINDWLCTDGGDPSFGKVNPGRPKNVHSSFNIKDLRSDRTLAPFTRGNPHKANSTYTTGEDSDILFHPNFYDTWWVGSGNAIYYTEDNGFSFDMLYDFGVKVVAMDHCFTNPNIIYAATWPGWWDQKRLYKSLDGGKTWTDVTPPNSVLIDNLWVPYDIVVDPLDGNKVTIVRTSMYGDTNLNGKCVYSSSNGGQSWTNISGTALNGQSLTNANGQYGINGGIFVGTRKGVFYKSASNSDFVNISSDLPLNTYSEKIIPYYKEQKLRNATNRSVWERPFSVLSNRVIANPSAQSKEYYCTNDTVYFRDHSVVSDDNVMWSWSFPGGTPTTSNLQHPKVIYDCPGVFDVSLTVSDQYDTNTRTILGMIKVQNDCKSFDEPYKSLLTQQVDDYVQVNNVDWNTNTMTVSAWIKPSGIQPNYSAIFMNDGSAAGFNFKNSNNSLAYHWPGGEWWWNSGLIVTPDVWSHVAMVVTPTSMTLYVNGQAATHNINLSPVEFNSFKIASYNGWDDRNFYGEIDELCIWDRALSTEEIRLGRHLTKDVATDTDVIAYYKFNQDDKVYDQTMHYHGNYNNSAMITSSDAPVGHGTSDIKSVSSDGEYPLTNSKVTLTFGSGTKPNGTIVVSKLYSKPSLSPTNSYPLFNSYYIINNYGTNQNFTGLQQIDFEEIGTVTNYMDSNITPTLYHRLQNSSTESWTSYSGPSIDLVTGVFGNANISSTSSSVQQFGQLYLGRPQFASARAQVTFKADASSDEFIPGGGSVELALVDEKRGLILPIKNENIFTQDLVTTGAMAYDNGIKSILFFNGTEWRKIVSKSIVEGVSVGTEPLQTSAIISPSTGENSSVLDLSQSEGYLILPSYTDLELVQINTPVERMMIYNSTYNVVQCFKDGLWKSVQNEFAYVAGTTPIQVDGMTIGNDAKESSAVVQISNIGHKTLALPSVMRTEIVAPSKGMIIYDEGIRAYMLFDGTFWTKFNFD